MDVMIRRMQHWLEGFDAEAVGPEPAIALLADFIKTLQISEEEKETTLKIFNEEMVAVPHSAQEVAAHDLGLLVASSWVTLRCVPRPARRLAGPCSARQPLGAGDMRHATTRRPPPHQSRLNGLSSSATD